MMTFFKLLRIKHYVKNGLVFLPVFFAKELLNLNLVKMTLVGFVVFSLTTSIVYIVNDIHDVESDRLHPIKKNRPIAASLVSVRQAWFIALFLGLVVIGLILTFSFNSMSIFFLVLYLLSNFLYSIKLKQYALIDISIIALSYILRVLFGGAIVNIVISNWLILTIMAFSFFMAFGKRRNELIKNGSESRSVLSKYKHEFLDKSMYVSQTMFIIFYSLWSLAENPFITHNNLLIWTVPIISMITFRYSMIIESDSYGDPSDILFSDKVLFSLVMIYVFFVGFIYFMQ